MAAADADTAVDTAVDTAAVATMAHEPAPLWLSWAEGEDAVRG